MSLLDSVSGEWDDDGFHLRLTTDGDGTLDLRVTDTEAARALLETTEKLREWVADHDEHLAAYLVASPEERARVVGRAIGCTGYRNEEGILLHDGDTCPIHEDDDRECLAVGADIARKRERENG